MDDAAAGERADRTTRTIVWLLMIPVAWILWLSVGPGPWRVQFKADVQHGQQQFERSGIRSYQVEFALEECLCLASSAHYPSHVRVTVRDGSVTSIDILGRATGTNDGGADQVLATVTEMPEHGRWILRYVPFEHAFTSLAQLADRVDQARVEFDQRSGTPRSVRVDEDRQTYDDEYTYTWKLLRIDN